MLASPLSIETVRADDLKREIVNTTWLPKADHPAIPADQVAGMLLAISAGAMSVSNEWNNLLPDHSFTKAEDFSTRVWDGKL
jgi:hypothetical protein